MNSEVKNFENLLIKYKLSDLKPVNVQVMAISSGRENLVTILKKTGHYSILFGLSYRLYYFLKGLGINATIFQAKIVLLAVSVNAAVSFAAGGLYLKKTYFSYLLTDLPVIKERINYTEKTADVPDEYDKTDKKTISAESLSVKPEYEIGIADFTGDNNDGLKVSLTIYKNLAEMIGQNKITFLKETKRKKVGKILTGSVRRIGKEKIVTVRLVNVKDSKIISIISEKINSDDEAESTCRKIAGSVAEIYLN